jgi:eukaryotic translation initiation factor 2C
MVNETHHDKALLADFGIKENPDVVKNMLTVQARILNPVNVYYNDFRPVRASNGSWRMINKKFLQTIKLEKWIVIWRVEKANEDFKNRFLDSARDSFTKNGLVFSKAPIVQQLGKLSVEEVFNLINKNCPNPQLVIFIIEDKNDEYAKIKSNAELKFGIVTQCLKFEKLSDQMRDNRKLDMYLSNVALKINSKIGGTNNFVDLSNLDKLILKQESPQNKVKTEPVMFFGADVTNFGGGERCSIASVVGSYDLNFTKYAARLSEQKNLNENRQSQEIILDLEEMSFTLIKTFQKNNNLLPKRIIFYRDGVDSGQFEKVLNEEIVALKQACKRLNFDPKITMIVVQKRHHARFFPIKQEDKSGRCDNIPSGSIVSTTITAKNLFDFYLCSHEAIQVYSIFIFLPLKNHFSL